MQNKPLLICGSGNSITQGIELGLLDVIPNHCSIGLNYWYKFGCETTFTTFVDYQFYRDNIEELEKLDLIIGKYDQQLVKCRLKDGMIYNIVKDNTILLPKSSKYFGKDSWEINKRECISCNNVFNGSKDLNVITEHCPKCRSSKIKKCGFYSAHLSGCFALTLGIALGFKEIYLLGFDCNEINSKTHFYQNEIRLDKKNMDNDTFYRGIGIRFDKEGRRIYNTSTYTNNSVNDRWFKPYKDEEGVNIYNVSMDSKLDVFPKLSYDEFFEKIKGIEVDQQKIREDIKTFIDDRLENNDT